MELLLSKSQKSSMMGNISFVLNIRTKLNDEEQSLVKKYKMGTEIVYEKIPISANIDGSSTVGLLTALTAKALKLIFTVNDLVKGRTIECKDIIEMIAAETQIRSAADSFYALLMAAKGFEGEEVITYPKEEK